MSARIRSLAVLTGAALAAALSVVGCGGAGGQLRATPSHLDLGEIAFEGDPSIVSITVENGAREAELIRFVRVDGDAPIRIAPHVSTCARGRRLQPKGSCTVVLTLQADRFGPVRGRVVIGYRDSGSPLEIRVDAIGGGKPVLRVLTSRLDFGSHGVAGGPASAPVTLASRGTAAAWLDRYTIEGRDASSFRIESSTADCSLGRIAPGTTCHLPIVFHSASHGRRRAVLVLTTKVVDSGGRLQDRTIRIPLSGGDR